MKSKSITNDLNRILRNPPPKPQPNGNIQSQAGSSSNGPKQNPNSNQTPQTQPIPKIPRITQVKDPNNQNIVIDFKNTNDPNLSNK